VIDLESKDILHFDDYDMFREYENIVIKELKQKSTKYEGQMVGGERHGIGELTSNYGKEGQKSIRGLFCKNKT
jgi:hypothetical protein